ncbi:Uncharacterised protein [Enterobacter hormaechei]|nr:Uncharacterised protein [Enterobacter hormaechei]
MLFDSINGRQETRPLETIAIKLIRRDIGGRHQSDPTRKQRFHEAPQQHGIRNIGNKELVEAEHVRFRLKAIGHNVQRVGFALERRQLFMDPQHKTVKVQALLTRAGQALVEHVHQPGLTPPNAAPHI